MMRDAAFPPGATIGVLGGGQLGRMLALAAGRLGFKCHVYAPEADSPAFEVAAGRTLAPYDDVATLERFAAVVDVITYEFENVPVETVAHLERLRPVRPGAKALAVAQDRLAEKRLARSLGAMTAEFAPVASLDALKARIGEIGLPAILKTNRFGYDGKGQAKILRPADIVPAYAAMGGREAILERFVPFEKEVSVVGARARDGAFAAFDVTENEHRRHILHRSTAPAGVTAAQAARAVSVAQAIGAALDYVGVFAVEFFVLPGGGDDAIYVNEIAPRVHNSGHWTLDGALTSQFEQHIRCVAGWPLGAPTRIASTVEMVNLIGDEAHDWARIAADPLAKLHLYGKLEAREGRKMGHVTRLSQP